MYALKREEIFSVSIKGMPISGERVFIQKMNQETRLKLESKNMAYEKDVKARKIAPYTIKADHTQSKSELHQL